MAQDNHPTLTSRLVALVLLTAALGSPLEARADIAAERGELARLLHELEQLETRIQAAESEASSTQRVHFQYAWLRVDLARVKLGIREYLETMPLAPRTVPPLAGDYIR